MAKQTKAAATAPAKISEQAAAKPVPGLTNVLNKLTVKAMGLSPADDIKEMATGETRVVARIYGFASKYKTGKSRFSTDDGLPREEVRFLGRFEGVNLTTGEIFSAPAAFMPNAAMTESLREAIDASDGKSAVEFGVEIAIKKIVKKDGTDGYQYGTSVPTPPQDSDPLARMRQVMSGLPVEFDAEGKAKALPAPEGDAPTT